MKNSISPDFNYESKFVNVLDSKIHYIDLKSENEYTFLFIHGNPTSSYLWRNVIPHANGLGRAVALDLIGFGKSGKPDIAYTFRDHIRYLHKFIQILELKNIILVLHDWGGALGFNYAMNNSYNVKGIAFMETFPKPMEWEDLDFAARWLFRKFRDPAKGLKWNGKYNFFLKFVLQASIIRKLQSQEKQKYREPFKTMESRLPIVKFPEELPFSGDGTDNEKIALNYFNWLKGSEIPKLLLYAKPGVQIRERQLKVYQQSFPNLETVYVGKGKHYIQEDQPGKIGEALAAWFKGKIDPLEVDNGIR